MSDFKLTIEHVTFALITVGLLCASDVIYLHASLSLARLWSVSLVALLLAISIYLHSKHRLTVFSHDYMRLISVYGLAILLSGVVHAAGLLSVPGDLVVNAEGYTAARALKRTAGFLFYYLNFSILIYSLYVLLHRLDLITVMRWIAVTVGLSCLVLYVQVFVDPLFFHVNEGYFHIRKFDGLSFQPNDFAMTLFLSLPLFMGGILLEKKIWVRLLYVAGIPLIFGALHFSGCRSALGGAMLFLFVLPVIFAMYMDKWSKMTRWFSIALPFALALMFALWVQTGAAGLDRESGLARVLGTFQSFQSGGVDAVYTDSFRGHQAAIALDLIKQAPLGGWGPGGFFREQVNIAYHATGLIVPARESALNHYLNVTSDFGIPVLLLLLLLLLIPVWRGIRASRRCPNGRDRLIPSFLIVVNIIFMFIIVTMPPTYAIEPSWLWTLNIALLLKFSHQYDDAGSHAKGHAIVSWVMVLFLLVSIAGSWQTSFAGQGYAVRQNDVWWDNPNHCLPPGLGVQGDDRQCGLPSKVRIWFPKKPEGSTVKVHVRLLYDHAAIESVRLMYWGKSEDVQSVNITGSGWELIPFRFRREDISYVLSDDGMGHRRYFMMLNFGSPAIDIKPPAILENSPENIRFIIKLEAQL